METKDEKNTTLDYSNLPRVKTVFLFIVYLNIIMQKLFLSVQSREVR